MKERYITDKVISLVDRMGWRKTVDRLEKQRKIAKIINGLKKDIEQAAFEMEVKITQKLIQRLNEEL